MVRRVVGGTQHGQEVGLRPGGVHQAGGLDPVRHAGRLERPDERAQHGARRDEDAHVAQTERPRARAVAHGPTLTDGSPDQSGDLGEFDIAEPLGGNAPRLALAQAVAPQQDHRGSRLAGEWPAGGPKRNVVGLGSVGGPDEAAEDGVDPVHDRR